MGLEVAKLPTLTLDGVLLLTGAGIVLYAMVIGPEKAARNIAEGAVGLVDDIAAGAVEGLGVAVGIPKTDTQKCARARTEGDILDASLYCDAITFAKWVSSRMRRGGGASGTW